MTVQTPDNQAFMFKRSGETTNKEDQVDTRAYFPYTELSYLVAAVCEPTESKRTNQLRIFMNYAHKSEDLLKSAQHAMDKPLSFQKLWVRAIPTFSDTIQTKISMP